MRLMRLLGVFVTLAVALTGAMGADDHRLVSNWEDPGFMPRGFKKVFVIGITDQATVRIHFENKFVSHLRGRQVDGVTSYSIVPQLDRVDDAKALVRALAEKGVDGAITVRVVELKDRTEEDWGKDWLNWVGSGPRIRGLIESTLPVPERDAKLYGVEVALWEGSDWSLVWAARSDVYKRKELEDAGGHFVQLTMVALRDAKLL